MHVIIYLSSHWIVFWQISQQDVLGTWCSSLLNPITYTHNVIKQSDIPSSVYMYYLVFYDSGVATITTDESPSSRKWKVDTHSRGIAHIMLVKQRTHHYLEQRHLSVSSALPSIHNLATPSPISSTITLIMYYNCNLITSFPVLQKFYGKHKNSYRTCPDPPNFARVRPCLTNLLLVLVVNSFSVSCFFQLNLPSYNCF